MGLDTGAGVSYLPFSLYQQKLNFIKMSPCNITLRTYSGNITVPKEEIWVDIEIRNVLKKCSLIIVDNKALLGRDILNEFNIPFKNSEVMINEIVVTNIYNDISILVSIFSDFFKNDLDT